MEAVVCQVCEEVKEFRFSKGKVCSHCNSELISRNGKYNGNQRYICKDCRKTFSDFTNSATYRNKKSLDKWLKYDKSMIMGLSIRKSAKNVGINIATSFFWRHKILDCIRAFLFVNILSIKYILIDKGKILLNIKSVAPIFGNAIKKIFANESISILF